MDNRLIAARDRFADRHPEQRILIGGREWGYVLAGDTGPALLLIPGTLGRGDIFWQQIEALEGRARIVAVTYPESGGVAEWAPSCAEGSASITPRFSARPSGGTWHNISRQRIRT